MQGKGVAAGRSGYDGWMNTSPSLSVDAVLRIAYERIDAADARLLLAHALDRPAAWLYAHGADAIDEPARQRFDRLLDARMQGQPVAYLTGTRGFWTLELEVNEATLIPRPETELLVELALARLPVEGPTSVADLGTGSGAIALAIAKERADAQVVATDASEAALAVARRNAARNDIANVEFLHGHWFDPLANLRFDAIVSNPPYIADGDPHLERGDLRFEPASALSSGHDGLDDIRQIVAHAGEHLVEGGWLLLEHGFGQGARIRGLLQAARFVEIETTQDMEHRDRVTLGQWP